MKKMLLLCLLLLPCGAYSSDNGITLFADGNIITGKSPEESERFKNIDASLNMQGSFKISTDKKASIGTGIGINILDEEIDLKSTYMKLFGKIDLAATPLNKSILSLELISSDVLNKLPRESTTIKIFSAYNSVINMAPNINISYGLGVGLSAVKYDDHTETEAYYWKLLAGLSSNLTATLQVYTQASYSKPFDTNSISEIYSRNLSEILMKAVQLLKFGL